MRILSGARLRIRVYQAPATAPQPFQVVTARQPDAPPPPVIVGVLNSVPDPYGPDPLVFGPPPGERTGEAGNGREFRCCGVRGPGMTCWACGR